METLADRLKQVLKDKDLTAKEFSYVSGIPTATISTIINGKVNDIKAETLFKIAHTLKVDVVWLYTGEARQGVKDISANLQILEILKACKENIDKAKCVLDFIDYKVR